MTSVKKTFAKANSTEDARRALRPDHGPKGGAAAHDGRNADAAARADMTGRADILGRAGDAGRAEVAARAGDAPRASRRRAQGARPSPDGRAAGARAANDRTNHAAVAMSLAAAKAVAPASASRAPSRAGGRAQASESVSSRTAAPGRPEAYSCSTPEPDERDIVTKKVEKKTTAAAADILSPVVAASVDASGAKAPARPAEKPAAKPVKSGARQGFKPQEFIVYPAHGVGQIVAIEEQEVAGFKLELFVISFVKDKMILKVPTPKVASVGMRKLAEADVVRKALDTLAGRARVKRTMWSRRAQEYEAKINSGDLIAIAEVVRDLYRSDSQPEQSYSERQLYEAALDRMAREVVVVQKLTETESLKLIEAQLQKGPRRAGKSDDVDVEDADIEEAA